MCLDAAANWWCSRTDDGCCRLCAGGIAELGTSGRPLPTEVGSNGCDSARQLVGAGAHSVSQIGAAGPQSETSAAQRTTGRPAPLGAERQLLVVIAIAATQPDDGAWARMPHSRKVSKSSLMNPGSSTPVLASVRAMFLSTCCFAAKRRGLRGRRWRSPWSRALSGARRVAPPIACKMGYR
jgi:hypothetical protein